MAVGYGVTNVLRPLIGLATAPAQVLALRFVERTGKGLRTSPRDAIIADCTPVSERGRAYGFNRSMDHAGAMLGALIAFALMTWFSMPLGRIFLLSAIPGLLAVLCVVVGLSTAPDPTTESTAVPEISLSPFDSRFRCFLLAVGVFALGNSSDAFLLLRARELGISLAFLPLLWIMLHALKSLSSTPAGALSDHFGRRTLILLGWALYAAVYVGFAAAWLQWHAWVLFAGYGLYYGLTEGVEKAFIADVAPSDLRSTAFGVYHFTVGLVAFPASLLCGWLWTACGQNIHVSGVSL